MENQEKQGRLAKQSEQTKQTVSIIIPTYNERGNIEKLVPEIFSSCKGLKAEIDIIIVDDNSPDGTALVAEELCKKYNVRLIRRSRKLGLASAVIKGFKQSKSDILGVMDADLSHPPEVLPDMLKPILSGDAEVVVGSRYVRGGGVEVWPLHRRLMSKIATLMAALLTPVKDPMSGLFFLKKSVIKRVDLKAKGYKIGLEVLVKGRYRKVCEVPYMFRNRFYGKSKISPSEYYHYLGNIMMLYSYKLTEHKLTEGFQRVYIHKEK